MTSSNTATFSGFAPFGDTLCPQCDYDLRDMPPAHECPECGLAYDEKTWVRRVSPSRWPTVVMIVLLGLPFAVFGLSFLLIRDPKNLLFLAVTSYFFLSCVFRFRRMKHQILGVTPRGLVFRTTRQARTQFAHWDKIYPINLYKLQFSMFLFGATVVARGIAAIDIKAFTSNRDEIIKLYELIETRRLQYMKKSDDA